MPSKEEVKGRVAVAALVLFALTLFGIAAPVAGLTAAGVDAITMNAKPSGK